MTEDMFCKPSKRFYSVQALRFIFSIMVVNYHFYSLYLRFYDSLPNYFCRSYLADEFFFMVSGYFIAQSAMKETDTDPEWTIRYIARRIKKIAIPYYSSWLLCFIGGRFANAIAGEKINIMSNLLNSIYELLFLEMLGFNKGLYSNGVGWFFSGLLISVMLICPFLKRFRKYYILGVAPVLGAFGLGILSLHYDYLFWPSKVLPEVPVLKGMVRAYSEINLGIFIFGVLKVVIEEKLLDEKTLRALRVPTFILWVFIICYMIVPFESNFDEPGVQYDYIFTILIMISLLLTFLLGSRSKMKRSTVLLMEKMGKASIYIFFGQPVIYSVYKQFFNLQIRTMLKFILLYIFVFAFSILIYCIDTNVKRFIEKG